MIEFNFENEVKQGITLVDFHAEWCGPCKMIEPIIEVVSNEVKDAKVIKVNVDDHPKLSAKYNIRSVPTFIVFKDGNIVETVVGAKPSKDYYLDLINNART